MCSSLPGCSSGAVVIVLAVVVTWWRRSRYHGWRRIGLLGLLTTVGVVLLATLFRGPPAAPCPSCLADWQLGKLTTGAVGTDVALNVVLFVPPILLATVGRQAGGFQQRQGATHPAGLPHRHHRPRAISWTIWFTTRCVIAQWTPTGFGTLQDAGANCTADFHP